MIVSFRSKLKFSAEEKGGLSAGSLRLISRTGRKRNYVNASSTSVSAVKKTVCAEKWRRKKRNERGQGVRRLKEEEETLPVFQTASPVVSAIDVGRRRRRRPRVSGAEEPAVNSRPIKRTNRQTSFREEATAPRRHRQHERIADHSLPNANYLYSPLAIKMCRAWTGAEGEGTISTAKGRRNVLQFRRNGRARRR